MKRTIEEIISEAAEAVFDNAMASMPDRVASGDAYTQWQWALAHEDGITSGWGGAAYDRARIPTDFPNGRNDDGDLDDTAHDAWSAVCSKVLGMYRQMVRNLEAQAMAELD